MATVTAGGLTLIACGLLSQAAADSDRHGRYGQHNEIHLLQKLNAASGFYPRTAINADGAQTPLATMVRVYQLKDRKAVDAADYQTLLRKADTVLRTMCWRQKNCW